MRCPAASWDAPLHELNLDYGLLAPKNYTTGHRCGEKSVFWRKMPDMKSANDALCNYPATLHQSAWFQGYRTRILSQKVTLPEDSSLSSEPSLKQPTPWIDFQECTFPLRQSVWYRPRAKINLKMVWGVFWQYHPQKNRVECEKLLKNFV